MTHAPQLAETRRAVTYRMELQRALAGGLLETASGTFLLLIAVKWFHAGATAKALIATGGGGGMLLSPLVVHFVTAHQWKASRAAAALLYCGSLGYLLAAFLPSLPVYILGCVAAQFSVLMVIPLLTQIYQDNYPESERGKLFSRALMIRIVASALFAQAGGWLLSENIAWFRWMLLVFGLALAFSGHCLWKTPSGVIVASGSSHPLQAMRFAVSDPLFGRALISWMFMGFGNLMMVPLRVDYLANPKYGLMLSAAAIAFLNGVVPNIARLCMSPVWGFLFDRLNFFLLRIIINISFAIGILTFFTGSSHAGLITGAIVFGIATAGGDLAWTLWVTKLAPPERVADYMSVHTFLTGSRNIIAPMVAFYASSHLSLAALGFISAAMIGVASLVLLPEIKFRARRHAAPVTEDFSE